MTILLKGRVGSHAYGLATPESDDDYLGVFAAPTEHLFTLRKPGETVVSKLPDTTMHEVEKFCRLALGGNPTILELLHLEDYVELHTWGQALLNIRNAFVSRDKIQQAYLGYVQAQLRRMGTPRNTEAVNKTRAALQLEPETDEAARARRAKNGRHVARLLLQAIGWELAGAPGVRLDPFVAQGVREWGEEAADGHTSNLMHLFDQARKVFERPAHLSRLPSEPDVAAVNYYLTEVRLHMLTARLP